MNELTVTLPAELTEKLRRHTPGKPPAQTVLDLVTQALAQEEGVERAEFPISTEEWLRQQRERFWRSSLGQYIRAQAEQARDRGLTLEQVQQMLAHDKSSWAADVIADREDRLRWRPDDRRTLLCRPR